VNIHCGLLLLLLLLVMSEILECSKRRSTHNVVETTECQGPEMIFFVPLPHITRPRFSPGPIYYLMQLTEITAPWKQISRVRTRRGGFYKTLAALKEKLPWH